MTAVPDPTTNVAVELAQLRGEINTGLESIKGTLGILVERTTRTDADVRQLRADMEAELQKIRDEEFKPLRTKVDALEDRRFPLPVVGALTGVGALLAAVIGLLLTR
ncbi:hypothetical protein SCAB_61321 [Streptomyces scabiei 87.22]|uniref:Uncharacterized protein n=1 Tax=Streptomyces scabiei (strain 87.22) TaxID=680198 RepID=C9Z964_STRSW|nr:MULTISPECIES: hypothetical protein [Streptomyces]MBP5875642.1 hypothetical protein [Streptomyces sp. LBUM 1477]MDX2652097.1 hypothetical protein [Streptomyces scabiei]MDX2725877.1 hypothetical protein [Streptomyces scabiei]MDX2863996.1 hypothetical protein [Streptomyces scabiei]MDX2881920.1 hypothetical protein [Streptomyces scabiei]